MKRDSKEVELINKIEIDVKLILELDLVKIVNVKLRIFIINLRPMNSSKRNYYENLWKKIQNVLARLKCYT